MEEKVRTTLDDEETSEDTTPGGPLSRLVETDLIRSPDTIQEGGQAPETKEPADYAKGTTEHDDDREG